MSRLKQQFSASSTGWNAFINEARGFEELKKLSAQHATQVFPKKTTLFTEGNNPRYLYYLHSGKVKLYKTSEYGKELIINICQEGDFIGYTTLIKEQPYTFSAATMEETTMSLIPKEDFQQLLYANKDVASRLIKMLANNISDKEEQLLHLAYHSVRKRVAEALLLLHDRFEKDGQSEISILREDLARIVGTAKESVIRMLTEFKEDGYIEVQDGGIKVINSKKLKDMPG